MAQARIYLGNIPFTANETEIREFFSGYEVSEVKIITDRDTGRSRGFAFVELADPGDLSDAISTLNGSSFGGRRAVVSEASEKIRRPPKGRREGRPRQ